MKIKKIIFCASFVAILMLLETIYNNNNISYAHNDNNNDDNHYYYLIGIIDNFTNSILYIDASFISNISMFPIINKNKGNIEIEIKNNQTNTLVSYFLYSMKDISLIKNIKNETLAIFSLPYNTKYIMQINETKNNDDNDNNTKINNILKMLNNEKKYKFSVDKSFFIKPLLSDNIQVTQILNNDNKNKYTIYKVHSKNNMIYMNDFIFERNNNFSMLSWNCYGSEDKYGIFIKSIIMASTNNKKWHLLEITNNQKYMVLADEEIIMLAQKNHDLDITKNISLNIICSDGISSKNTIVTFQIKEK